MDLAVNLALTGVGLAMLCYGGNWLVGGGVSIARRVGISNIVIGMTVVAYGTSTPELAASIAAAGEHSQIMLGNVVGSNIANVGMVIGVSAMLIPLAVRTTIRRELLVMAGASMLLIALSADGEISRYDGALLIALLIAFTVFAYRSIRKEKDSGSGQGSGGDGARTHAKKFYLKPLGLLGAGIALLYVGSELTVTNAVSIAHHFGISEKIIGLTVIAIGTSLPELITSVIAIRKGHTDIGIGNIVGSNIYNILMIMGVASALAGVAIVDDIYVDYLVMIAFVLALFAVMKTGLITRKIGIGLTVSYAAYMVSSFLFLK